METAEQKTCPRCGTRPLLGEYRDALSRVSDALSVAVDVCSDCGEEEAKVDPHGEKGFEGWARAPPPSAITPLKPGTGKRVDGWDPRRGT